MSPAVLVASLRSYPLFCREMLLFAFCAPPPPHFCVKCCRQWTGCFFIFKGRMLHMVSWCMYSRRWVHFLSISCQPLRRVVHVRWLMRAGGSITQKVDACEVFSHHSVFFSCVLVLVLLFVFCSLCSCLSVPHSCFVCADSLSAPPYALIDRLQVMCRLQMFDQAFEALEVIERGGFKYVSCDTLSVFGCEFRKWHTFADLRMQLYV